MIERAENRRQFFQRLPVRVATVGAATSLLLAGCSEISQPAKIEPRTQPEKDMAATLRAFNRVLTYPHVPQSDAVTLAQDEIEGKNTPTLLPNYDQIKAPYLSSLSDSSIFANLAYSASRFKYNAKTTIELYEKAKSGFFLDNDTPADIASLAMAHGGDLNKPLAMLRRIANDDALTVLGLTTNFDSPATLTSIGLLTSEERALQEFRKMRTAKSIWNTDRNIAVLALASTLNGDPKRTLDAFAKVDDYKFKHIWDRIGSTENRLATLALAGSLGKYSIEDVLSMYEFARNNAPIDANTAIRLTLATSAAKSGHTITSRKHYYMVGKVTNEALVPILLS